MSTKQFMKKITPECETMTKRVVTLNTISIMATVIAVVLLIVALVYIYTPMTEENAAKNKSTAGVSAIFALLFTLVATVVSIWQVMIAGKLKGCIEKAPNTAM